MTVLLTVSGGVAAIYAFIKKDNPTAVAIGAWMTAVQVMVMTSIFFWFR